MSTTKKKRRRRRRVHSIDERIVALRREVFNENPAEAWRKHKMNHSLKALSI